MQATKNQNLLQKLFQRVERGAYQAEKKAMVIL
jgi:hypothetical protein